LPTNQARDWKGAIGHQSQDIPKVLSILPTPRAGNPGSRPNKKGGRVLAEEIGKETGKRLRLSVAFVNWMMGYPDGWCDFPMEQKSPTQKGDKKD